MNIWGFSLIINYKTSEQVKSKKLRSSNVVHFNPYPAGTKSDQPLPPVYSLDRLHLCAVDWPTSNSYLDFPKFIMDKCTNTFRK